MQVKDKLIEGDFFRKTLKIDGDLVDCNVPHWIESQNNQIKDELVDFVFDCYGKKDDLPGPLLTIEEICSTVKIIEEISDILKNKYNLGE